jgi:uncharacterized RDD family membrane protein YckC
VTPNARPLIGTLQKRMPTLTRSATNQTAGPLGGKALTQILIPHSITISMNENFDSMSDKDILGQDIPPVFVKTEEITKKKEQPDYSKVYVLPSIKTRYFSTFIDILVILGISLGISYLFEKIGEVPNYVRAIAFIVVFILYEPLLVSFGATIGQLLLDIRVKSFKNPQRKLPIVLAAVRTLCKVFLGWISFITVTFNLNRRAIHDFASNSIVIENKK